LIWLCGEHADYSSFYVGINFIFASIYYVIGIEHLKIKVQTVNAVKFGQAYFLVHKRLPLWVMVTSVPLVLTSALSAAEL
jgi:inward rectifier potassium channel